MTDLIHEMTMKIAACRAVHDEAKLREGCHQCGRPIDPEERPGFPGRVFYQQGKSDLQRVICGHCDAAREYERFDWRI